MFIIPTSGFHHYTGKIPNFFTTTTANTISNTTTTSEYFNVGPLGSKTNIQTTLEFGSCILMRVRKIAKSYCWLCHVSFSLSTWNNSSPNGQIFMKFDNWEFFENLKRKFKFNYNMTRITCTLHEDICTFTIISRRIILRMINISDKSCGEYQSTHFTLMNFFSKIVPFMR
jgi:hypothetical protein